MKKKMVETDKTKSDVFLLLVNLTKVYDIASLWQALENTSLILINYVYVYSL